MSAVALTDANVVTFITTDPRAVGFAAIRTANPGADAPLIAAANNTSGPGAGTVAGDPISSQALLDAIDGVEFNAMTSPQLQQLQTIMTPGNVDMGSAPSQSKLTTLLASYATSKAAIEAKYNRAAGPFEVYFGKGNICTQQILDSARNSGAGNNF
jgi:hypothetical protein